MKYNIILHTTTSCNYDCSYCDVVKDNKNISKDNLGYIYNFVKTNYNHINRFKFFGGEPLLRFEDIKIIINSTKDYIGNNYEIVTNTSLLTDEIGEYFKSYFTLIFFSIDTENNFNYEKVFNFIKKYNLENKVYFNLVVNPGDEKSSLEQFNKLYSLGLRGYNILPVYYTKKWENNNLKNFSDMMKKILDLSIKDESLKLYGFTEDKGTKTSLINESLFLDTTLNIYYSDIVSTFKGKYLKSELLIGNIYSLNMSNFKDKDFKNYIRVLENYEEKVSKNILGHYKLHKIMDYFSVYLNNKEL